MGLRETILAEVKDQGLAEGRAEGHAEGFAEGQQEMVINMFRNGVAADEISKLTNIPLEKVKNYLRGMEEGIPSDHS